MLWNMLFTKISLQRVDLVQFSMRKTRPNPKTQWVHQHRLEIALCQDSVLEIRSHPDFRIFRRATVISRLSQGIAERDVKAGLRRVLLVQAKRLQWLAEQRYQALGGDTGVEIGHEENGDDED